MRPRPRIVVTIDAARIAALARPLADNGMHLHDGWDLPDDPWDLRPSGVAAFGAVAESDAAHVVRAASRCAVVVAALPADAPWALSILADLHRLGPVQVDRPAERPDALPLTGEQLELLALVAQGATSTEAAAQLYLSQRTAERRLASIRAALGVRSTAEAIGRWLASPPQDRS